MTELRHRCVAASSVRARVTVVQSSSRTLIAIVRPRRPRLAEPLAELARRAAQDTVSSSLEVGDVVVERALSSATWPRPLGLDRRVVLEVRAALAGSARRCAPKRSASSASSACCELRRACASPSSREPLGGLRADAGHAARRRGREAHARLLAAHARRSPAGLPGSLQHLATSREGPMPTESAIAGLLLDRGDQPRAATRSGFAHAGQLGVGLVEPDLLRRGRAARARRSQHALGRLAVGREVGRDDDRVGAQPARPRGRHRRADAELARLVGRGGDHRARAGARHDDRLAPQLGAAQQLDGRVERVQSRCAMTRLARHTSKRTPGASGLAQRVVRIAPWPWKCSAGAVASVRSYSRPAT